MVVAGVIQTLMALSTMSPDATAQFNKLVNLAAVTNIVPYILSISALMVVMYKAKTVTRKFRTNLIAVFVAIFYSIYALYASGMEAVMGGTIVMMIGYLLYGFIAKRFVGQEAPGAGEAAAAA